MEWLTNPEIWISLITLTVMEIVLGIDNIVFISILTGKLPAHHQDKARKTGLALAMITRVLLLLSISWVMRLKGELFNVGAWMGVADHHMLETLSISGRDLILLVGGLFLIYKSTAEIHEKLEGGEHEEKDPKANTFSSIIIQILLLDIIFSLDSVITAVGMADHVGVMIAAVIKMLALSFLLLIGVSLIAEAFERGIPKGYVYFAMAFSVLVEMLNLRAGKKSKKAH